MLDMAGKLTEGGVVMILLFFIIVMVFGVGATIRYLMRRLFDEQNGIVTQLAGRFLEAVDKLIKSTDDNVRATKDIASESKKTGSHVVHLDKALTMSRQDLDNFRKVWRRSVGMLRKIAKHFEIEDVIKNDLDRLDDTFEAWEKRKLD